MEANAFPEFTNMISAGTFALDAAYLRTPGEYRQLFLSAPLRQ
jgi:hypothetical protein